MRTRWKIPSRRGWRCRMKHESKAVHAITQAGGLRPVVKHVTEMPATSAAMHLGSGHAKRAVLGGSNGIVEGLEETRPARAALELRFRRKQRQIASRTGKNSLAMLLQ